MPLASLLWVAWGTGWLAETQVAVLRRVLASSPPMPISIPPEARKQLVRWRKADRNTELGPAQLERALLDKPSPKKTAAKTRNTGRLCPSHLG